MKSSDERDWHHASRRHVLKLAGAAGVAVFSAVAPAKAVPQAAGTSQNATIPEDVVSPHPTITNLAIEWKVPTDEHLGGVVRVEYRAVGGSQWRRAMPLRRIPAGRSIGTRPIFHWDDEYSGSIFDLRPNTAYEIRLKLTDRERRSAERTIRVRTRPVPRAAPNARIRHVTPQTLASAASAARPGDILLLTPGKYGAFTATRDGEPDKPIVIRSRSGGVVRGRALGGGAVFDSISLQDRRYVHLDRVTVNGSVDLLGGEELVVRRCVVNAVFGIIAKGPPGMKNCYIADNVVTGIMPWENLRMGHLNAQGEAANRGEGIQVTGPGNVICHNRVIGYRDCISLMEDRSAHEQVCVDIYNNDVYRGMDDGIEADFAMGNVRVLRNRLTNCFVGLSSQPSLGGPTYFVRNVMYNLTGTPFKLSRHTVGAVILHNTTVKVGDGGAARRTTCPASTKPSTASPICTSTPRHTTTKRDDSREPRPSSWRSTGIGCCLAPIFLSKSDKKRCTKCGGVSSRPQTSSCLGRAGGGTTASSCQTRYSSRSTERMRDGF